jgi:two-component system, chemotaxis family, chemotaxis protein CheY
VRTLIVEDDFASRFVLQRMFQGYGICHTAVNGEEGLESFKLSNENGELYDLICLDIMMPKMDGKELLRKIRDLEEMEYKIVRSKRSKIIMVTALNDYDNIKTSFMNLCDGYIFKPFKKEKILEEIKKLGLLIE